MQKYTIGRQQILIHCFKDEKKLDVIESPDFLKKPQKKYTYCSQWTPFYFGQFSTPHNIVLYQFLSENEEEMRMHEHFCCLAIS